MTLFRKPKSSPTTPNWKITKSCLDLIFECSKSSYPHEFGGFLKTEKENTHTISELVLLPGTISGDSHAIFKLHMLPIDFSIVGTAHSHPSNNYHPSPADLDLFSRYGKIHIITAYPYLASSWQAYTYSGGPVQLTIV